jgi:hypothetical protein
MHRSSECFFICGFPTKNAYAFVVSITYVAFLVHLILFNLITLILSDIGTDIYLACWCLKFAVLDVDCLVFPFNVWRKIQIVEQV